MSEAEIECFHDSHARCIGAGRFIDRFYARFVASSDEVRQKFEHTEMRKQRRVLSASIYMIMLAAENLPEARTHLEHLAELHSKRQRDIPPRLYDLLLDCMLKAVEECDPHFTPEIGRVWRRMMENGIAIMKAGYDADLAKA